MDAALLRITHPSTLTLHRYLVDIRYPDLVKSLVRDVVANMRYARRIMSARGKDWRFAERDGHGRKCAFT